MAISDNDNNYIDQSAMTGYSERQQQPAGSAWQQPLAATTSNYDHQ